MVIYSSWANDKRDQTLNGRADFLNNQYIFVLSKGHL